jgi:hypothetical protein
MLAGSWAIGCAQAISIDWERGTLLGCSDPREGRVRARLLALSSHRGTVKLTEPRARGDEFWSRWASGDGACVGDLVPDSKAAVTRSAAGCSRCRFWIRDMKEVRDLIVNRQEPLRLPG